MGEKRYYDMGMVDTVSSDFPTAEPTTEEIADLLDRIEKLTKTLPLDLVYKKLAARGALPWADYTYEEQNGIIALQACYNAQLRDNARALSEQAT